jgi:flavin-dependent dehydrogenase
VLQAEVLVVGAGPAGATAALNLAPTRSVILAERQPETAQRIGESVPPVVGRLLADMGLLESFLEEGHAPCYGNRSVWGGDLPAETDFLRDPDGHGWHLNRARFEAWLRQAAVARGATLLAPAAVKDVKQVERAGGRWRVLFATPTGPETVEADVLIDAGGRSASLASRLGARRRILDRLVCGWLYGRAETRGRGCGLTYIEAAENGWWYTAPLPGDRRVLAFHTDADLPSARVARDRDTLLACAHTHHELSAVLGESGFMADDESGFTAAHSALLEPCAGPSWIAAGDAALSFDPLSSQGLLNALFTGLASAETADRHLRGFRDAFDEYTQTIDGICKAYVSHLKSWYQTETRWPNSPFWRRRHAKKFATGESRQLFKVSSLLC